MAKVKMDWQRGEPALSGACAKHVIVGGRNEWGVFDTVLESLKPISIDVCTWDAQASGT